MNAELRNLPPSPRLPQSLELRTTLLCRERRHAFDSPKHIVGNSLITRELRLFSRNESAILLRYSGFCMKIESLSLARRMHFAKYIKNVAYNIITLCAMQ